MRILRRNHRTYSCHRMRRVFLDGYLLTILAISCNLQVSVSECVTSVQSKRREVFMPEGSSVSLVCKILHCGQEGWRGAWRFTAKGHSTLLIPSARHHVSNYTENANSINLLVTVQSLNQSDSGAYQCYVKWKNNLTSAGHVTYVNVTTVDPESGRRLYHRLLVCGAAGLCLFLVLGLTCCTSSSQRLAPPVPLRRRGPPTARVNPKAGVVYATIVLDKPRHHREAQSREEPILYSTVNFSTA
ncbi:uncharacterized protein si:dkey-52l18.4 isoform X2 [Electrophorus electricus]|uniref:uncharacterized protein si:dkey-52l18.4 isoform X2 n=1 Tax=Electrophorus electricus TaxID=8005 RepID=UPI0015D0A004|nr:uncharacterized protein si:dkey-52l18.4 isoform X2 [Electrophorus electricus]